VSKEWELHNEMTRSSGRGQQAAIKLFLTHTTKCILVRSTFISSTKTNICC